MGERLPIVLRAFYDYDIIVLPGTRMRKKSVPHSSVQHDDNCTPSRWEGYSHDRQFYIVSWGYSQGQFTNKASGITIAINCNFVSPQAVVWRYDPSYKLAGRLGALRIRTGRTPNDADLVIIGAYAPQTTAPEESLSAFWDAVHSVVQQVPARSTLLCGLDANGDPTFAEDARIGPCYPAGEPSVNGERLRELCVSNGLLVLDTWRSRIRL